MRIKSSVFSRLSLALISSGMLHVHAADAPYYNPANAASSNGLTVGYELFKTIGCPGRGILDAPCAGPVVAQPVAPAAPAVVVAPKDSDGDGVIDANDRCPTTPAGRTVNPQGCELDGDGDGVVDALDKCPTTPAGRTVDAKGCEMDGDGDGILDNVDQCPTTPAGDRVDSKGCSLPAVFNLIGVNFDTAKDTLRPEATVILDEAVAILKRYPGLKVEIAGHTDSAGSDDANQKLSQQRATTVMNYFIDKGVEAGRMSAKGYGEVLPIADNAAAAGRSKNRRVELRSLN